jgi:hypothetical protein
MSFKVTHDLHQRRFGRNLGVGLLLASFIALGFGWTVYKVVNDQFLMPVAEVKK